MKSDVALLRATPIFDGLDDLALGELQDEVDVVTVPGGETVIREHEPGDCLYIVVGGRLRAFVTHESGTEETVGDIVCGESVGEMAVLTGTRRTASVRAVRDSQLLRLSKRGFDRLVDRAPQTAMQLARLLVVRLQHTLHHSGDDAPLSLVIVSSGDDVPLSRFAQDLAVALGRFGRTDLLDSAAIDEALGAGAAQAASDSAADVRVMAWLDERQRHAQFSLYKADATATEWSRRCLRQADRVLIVARATGPADIRPVEARAWWTDAPKELVLLHDPGASTAPTGTARWLEPPRQFALHHHVRVGVDQDVERLARLLSGRAVGVVLGGGGARAFAHIGVMQALREARIPIDVIGGTSMGAVIAAQYAMGHDDATVMASTRRAFVDGGSLFDYTVPLMSLIEGLRFVRALEQIFGTTRIEDLWLKYFCVSTNLTRADQTVHETGRLSRWLCASISVPGLAPPVFHRGDLLVDGSVLNTVPSDVMRGLRRGPVIAVDVTARVDLGVDPSWPVNPTSWQVLWSRLNPFARSLRVPSLYRILLRTTMLSSAQSVERIRNSVELYIHPRVEEFDLLDWKAFDRIVARGYDAGREAVKDWGSTVGGRESDLRA